MSIKKSWRKCPFLLKFDAEVSNSDYFSRSKFEEWISQLNHMRVFSESDRLFQTVAKNQFSSRLIPNEFAISLFEVMLLKREKFTILLNDVDTIDKNVVRIRDELNIPCSWRNDDIVATYSTDGSGIGYHAGHEDAVIFQAKGKRHWKIWDQSEINFELKKRIIISELDDIYSFTKTDSKPIFECILEEGDMLYIPPFYPHEGITLEESVSIAIGWKGITYFHLLQAFANNHMDKIDYHNKKYNWLFELVDDTSKKIGSSRKFIDKLIVKRLHEIMRPHEVESFTNKVTELMSR